MSFVDKAKEFLPGIGTVNLIATWMTYAVIFIVVSLAAAGLAWWWANNRKYYNKIIKFEKVGNTFQDVGVDWAKIVRIGHTGDTVHYWRKGKLFRPTPQIQTGARKFWYFLREDGEWINFGIGDLDRIARELGCVMVITDIRHAKEALRKNLKETYDKPGFLERFGAHIALLSLMFMFAIAVWFAFYQMTDVLNSMSTLTDKVGQFMETANGILIKIDNVQGGGSGSGLVPAMIGLGLWRRR